MGFYIRKSLRVGPLRFNLSKSGVGVSAGIRGFRVGTGPRGNYVHMGRYGLYYRATLPSAQRVPQQPGSAPANYQLDMDHKPFEEIESGDVQAMQDSSSTELLDEINRKQKKIRLFPVLLILGGVAIVGALASQVEFPRWALVAVGMLAVGMLIGAYYRDQIAKTVVLFYDLDDKTMANYEKVHDAFEEMMLSVKVWHVEAEAEVEDRKRNAGATSLIRRTPMTLTKASPPFVKTNIEVPKINAGKQNLYFFPDRLLVFDSHRVGAVGYQSLVIERRATQVIEDNTVPRDARVVDPTWKYVNKRGGPDLRYKDNREFPVALYKDIHFKSDTGLNVLIEFSRIDVGDSFSDALNSLGSVVGSVE